MSGLQRYYEGLLVLLLAVAFTTLASTGRLGWPVVAAAAAAFVARGVAYVQRRRVALPPKWLLLGILAYLPVYAADGFLLHSGFLDATLRLVVLAGVAKIFCEQSERDRLAMGLLAMLEVMAAALVTVSG